MKENLKPRWAVAGEVLLIGAVENDGAEYRPWLQTLPNPLVDATAPIAAGIVVLLRALRIRVPVFWSRLRKPRPGRSGPASA